VFVTTQRYVGVAIPLKRQCHQFFINHQLEWRLRHQARHADWKAVELNVEPAVALGGRSDGRIEQFLSERSQRRLLAIERAQLSHLAHRLPEATEIFHFRCTGRQRGNRR
jgi:hypothetical protein